MKRIYNRFIPVKGFACMAIYWLLFVRDDLGSPITAQDENHERIHAWQHIEIWALSAVVVALSTLFGLSWWWMLATPVCPFIIYVVCWLVELVIPPYDRAYGSVCFESEAIYNEADLEYCRRRVPFAWLKYISNKKYPYLPKSKR